MYHVISENDPTKIFSTVVDTFLMAFAIGFHLKGRKPVTGEGSINHANMSAVQDSHQNLIIILMLDRHPDLKDGAELWNMVEEYAEYGIEILYASLRRSDWVLDVDDVFQNPTD